VNLNDSQKAAFNHVDGPLMVFAGPGSGKTTVITHRALQLIKKCNPKEVLVITFSKAAATEMENRFKKMSNGLSCTFGTFHAIFFRVLRHRYNYSLENIFYEGERRNLVKNLLIKFEIEPDEDILLELLNEISLVKNEMYDIEGYNSKSIGTQEFTAIFSAYEQQKRQHKKIDFDDMLTLCHNLWQAEPDYLNFWQNKFKYIMIDEFQDINQVQYECIKMLSVAPHNLCIVGDDDQSIYRFRGSRPEFLLNFTKDFPQAKQILLDVNYRSTDDIITFSNNIIVKNENRFPKKIIGTNKPGVKPTIATYNDQNSEAKTIANQIRKNIDKNPNIQLNEIAIIYRTNMQARAFTDAFMLTNIPFIIRDEISSVYNHWIAQDIFAYFRLANGTAFIQDVERIINKPFRYISKAFLQKIKQENLDIFQIYHKTEMLNSSQKGNIDELFDNIKALNKRKTQTAIKFIRKNLSYDAYIKEHCEYQKTSPIGLYEILNELQEAAEDFPIFADFMQHAENATQPVDQQSATDRVTLTTMHSAKGLEFDNVYVIGAVEGLIPHERSRTAAEIEEERRLFYVAATRARQNLTISVIKKRHEKNVEPTRFLEEYQNKTVGAAHTRKERAP